MSIATNDTVHAVAYRYRSANTARELHESCSRVTNGSGELSIQEVYTQQWEPKTSNSARTAGIGSPLQSCRKMSTHVNTDTWFVSNAMAS